MAKAKRTMHSEETKRAVLHAVANRGGTSVASILEQFGVSSSDLSRWRKNPKLANGSAPSAAAAMRQGIAGGITAVASNELEALRFQNTQLRAALKALL